MKNYQGIIFRKKDFYDHEESDQTKESMLNGAPNALLKNRRIHTSTEGMNRTQRFKRIGTSVPVNKKKVSKLMKSKHPKEIYNTKPQGAFQSLRDQLRRINLRDSSPHNDKNKTLGQLSLVSHIKNNSLSKNGVFGLEIDRKDPQSFIKHNQSTSKNSTRYKKFMKSRRTDWRDEDQKFHEEMVAFKDSLPQFFKNSNFVLINKQGELLEEETEALKAQISKNQENYQETEVPFSNNDEESIYEGKSENERIIQLIPKKFKENLIYKYRDKNTSQRLKGIREVRRNIPKFENKSDILPSKFDAIRSAERSTVFSPKNFPHGGNLISNPTDLDSKGDPIERTYNGREYASGYPKDDDQQVNEDLSDKGTESEEFDLVKLQNEAFSKMFVENKIDDPTSKGNLESYRKSTYPRSKIPFELKQKFDVISDNFNYNDEFWRPEDVMKHDTTPRQEIRKPVFSKIKDGEEEIVTNGAFSAQKRARTTHEKNPNKDKIHEQIGYIKADWIDKIIKIKENMDKKCKCCNKIYCDVERKPRLDTGTQHSGQLMSQKRSHTAIEGPMQTERFLSKYNVNVPPIRPPQSVTQSARGETQELSIFQHYTINNAYIDEAEKNFIPQHPPINISKEECSQINSDLRRYLENGQRLEPQYHKPEGIATQEPIQTLSDDKRNTFYVEKQEGDWQKLDLASPGSTYRTGGLYSQGYSIVYAQPKPVVIRANVENNEWLLKHLKRRRPKNLVKKIFQPVSMERKPFVVQKWTSPFDQFRQKRVERGNAKSMTVELLNQNN
ncbi:unnamed protein product [Moneuplotes crassus]|uniref:Uncharacterized protein n=1 Tax=Euplotes crassus TaxID=5936 RepID=A0AAD1Y6M3_EUPCR|nr:unnamed protein product [Moneuplotes crassus]